jgi:hypothetical protein
MSRDRNHCAAPGCGRFIRRDATWCRRHEAADVAADREDAGDEHEAAEAFRRRLAQGEYRRLFGDRVNEVIQQAAAEQGLVDEIGILRIVLARLLLEEDDPAQLAESVSRVAGVAIQAARAQRAISGEQANGITEAVTQLLIELDGAKC